MHQRTSSSLPPRDPAGPDLAAAAAVLRRPVCDLLECRYPLVLAGMGGVSRSELVVAVTSAGGFGFLGMVREPVALIRTEVQQVRACTGRSFGVSLIPAATEAALLDAQVGTCIDLGVPVVGLFWDLSAALVRRLRDAGILVVCQVGAVSEACAAQDAGAQVLVVQGREAGGHVRSTRPLVPLLADVLAAAAVPVLAAGGISDGAGMATVLSLGAQGAVVGTAMIPTHESFAHDFHKRRITEAVRGQTLLTDAFHLHWPRGARTRVLTSSVTRGERGNPFGPGRTVIGEEAGRPVYLFSTDSPLRSMTGDFEAMALYAGEGAGRIRAVTGAAERLHGIVADAAARLRAGGSTAADEPDLVRGPVESFGKSNRQDLPAGFADRRELVEALNELLASERAGARVTLRCAAEAGEPTLQLLATAIHRDEVRWCGALIAAVRSLQASPTPHTGAFYDKAMALEDPCERMALLGLRLEAVVRKLRRLAPRVGDETLRGMLTAMLVSHEDGIVRLGPWQVPVAGTGRTA